MASTRLGKICCHLLGSWKSYFLLLWRWYNFWQRIAYTLWGHKLLVFYFICLSLRVGVVMQLYYNWIFWFTRVSLFWDCYLMQTRDKVVEASQFMQIYRSREVGQSYITSVWTTLLAIAHGLWLMIKIRPEVVLLLNSFFFIISWYVLLLII